MEFAVRLDDKVNTQVFCSNPVHKGNHMDRVVYKDATFNAPCPICRSNDWLYRKNNAISKKGHVLTFKPDGWTNINNPEFAVGSNELKHFGFVRIDCTEEQARELCEGIHNEEKEAEARDYREQANARKQVITETLSLPISKSAMKEALESDAMYLTLEWSWRQAENRAQIDARPCKQSFDFEKVLSVNDLKTWNDQRSYSKVIDIDYNTTIINMKAIE